MKLETDDNRIRIEASIPVPRQQAWAFLTEKAHLSNWWGDHATLEAKPGGTFLEKWFDGERQVITSGKILYFNPPSELTMSWADEDWPGETNVSFHLSENSDNTRLVLEHSGWGIHPTSKRDSLIDAHAAGWSQYLERFGVYATDNL